MSWTEHEFVRLRVHVGHDRVAGALVDLRVSSVDVLIGCAAAVAIVWTVMRAHAGDHGAEAQDREVRLRAS